MATGRPKKTVERILAAATANFATHGYQGARMEAIAKSAKVNKATIYYHIGDKKALYSAVLHRVFGEQAALIAQQIEATPSSRHRLKVVIRALRGIIEQKPHITAILMHEFASGGRNFPDQLARDFSQIIGLTHDTLQEGIAANQFAAAHPMVVYLMAVAPMVYYEKIYNDLHKHLATGSKERDIPVISFQDFADHLEELVLKALKP